MRLTLVSAFLSLPALANVSEVELPSVAELPLTLRLKDVQQGHYHAQLKAGAIILCDVAHTIDLQEEEPTIKRYEHDVCEDVTEHLWAFYPCMSRLFPEVPSVPVTVCANIPLSLPAHVPLSGITLHFTATFGLSGDETPTSFTRIFTGDMVLSALSGPPENHYLDLGNGFLYDEERSYMTHVSESCSGQCCVLAHPTFSS